jgi:hypothetical protein
MACMGGSDIDVQKFYIYKWDYLFRVKKMYEVENLVISDIDRKKLDVEIYKV